ncbi:MAG: hypothetical protein V4612_04115 [Pseudomonadota bacterium]
MNDNFEYQKHRRDLADSIIFKSLTIKQKHISEAYLEVLRELFIKPLGRFSMILMLLISFVCGFSNGFQKFKNSSSVFEEIYYSNTEIL